MFYAEGFLTILIYISLFCLIPVLAFQIVYFVRDVKEKSFWNR